MIAFFSFFFFQFMKTRSIAEGEPSIIELQRGLAAVHTDVSFLKDSLSVMAASMEDSMQRFQAQMLKQMQELLKGQTKQKHVDDPPAQEDSSSGDSFRPKSLISKISWRGSRRLVLQGNLVLRLLSYARPAEIQYYSLPYGR
jgi:hypothetical protein